MQTGAGESWYSSYIPYHLPLNGHVLTVPFCPVFLFLQEPIRPESLAKHNRTFCDGWKSSGSESLQGLVMPWEGSRGFLWLLSMRPWGSLKACKGWDLRDWSETVP